MVGELLTEFGASVGANDSPARRVTLEEEDVKCVCHLEKLFLRDLLLLPELFRFGSQSILDVPF